METSANIYIEDLHTEYKHNYSPAVLKTICAFLNTDGGTIFITPTGGTEYNTTPSLLLERIKRSVDKYFKEIPGINITIDPNNLDAIIIKVDKYEIENDFVSLSIKPETSKTYYFRVGDRNIKSNLEQAPYWQAVGMYDLPVLRSYTPHHKEQKYTFEKAKFDNQVEFNVVGLLPRGSNLYKYMDLESALLSLDKTPQKNPNLRFVEPTFWEDQYEGRFYNATYDNIPNDPTRAPFLYACCFSAKKENEAAWILYSHGRNGLACRCVEFSLNRAKLRNQLVSNLRDCTLYIGAVNYQSMTMIDNLHLSNITLNGTIKKNEDYYKYFEKFSREKYINLLLLKRPAFEHEKEVRIFIVPNSPNKGKTRRDNNGNLTQPATPKFVDIDWIDVIEEIRIDKNCSDYEKRLLRDSLNRLLQEKQNTVSLEYFQKLQSKVALKEFDPYRDDSIKEGPLSITTLP